MWGWNEKSFAKGQSYVSLDAVISMIGTRYHAWVLAKTKEPAIYKDAVQRFREMSATSSRRSRLCVH